MLEELPEILKEDGYPDVRAFMATYRKAEAVVEQYNRDLAEWSARSGKSAGQPKKNDMRRPKRKASVTSLDGCRRRAERKSQSAKPTTWNDSLTLKTTPQASCGAYIKNAPCGFVPQGAGYMDLSAVFSLAIVKNGAGQSSTRSQHYKNPKDDVAVVAGFRGKWFRRLLRSQNFHCLIPSACNWDQLRRRRCICHLHSCGR